MLAADLAAGHGTPLYVYDASTLRARARSYREPVSRHPGGGLVAFACKACPTVGVLRLLGEEGLGADVASEGELAAALRAGIPPARIVFHGNAKTEADIEAAVGAACGLLVIDGLDEPPRVGAAARRLGRRQPVAVRVTPGIRAGGHAAIETGGAGSKFGLDPVSVVACVDACLQEPGLEWRGLHVHLGSQIADVRRLEGMVAWLAAFCREHGLAPRVVDLGGGLAIAYDSGPSPDPRRLATTLVEEAGEHFPKAMLLLEPGRSIAGPAGVILYRAVTTKTAGNGARAVAVDGGMSDNIRPALYGATYTVAAADRLRAPAEQTADVVGKHCESGDVLVRGARLPRVAPGELLAVASTGAYAQSMASTYNGTPRAAAVLVEDGNVTLLTRRETVADLLARDL